VFYKNIIIIIIFRLILNENVTVVKNIIIFIKKKDTNSDLRKNAEK